MKKGKIYIIKCWSSSESFIKLGYTYKSVKVRFKDLEYNYRILRVVNVKNPKEIETSIHRYLTDKRYHPKIKFVGYTECYKISTFNQINNLINEFYGIKNKLKPKKKKTITNTDNYISFDYKDISMFKS